MTEGALSAGFCDVALEEMVWARRGFLDLSWSPEEVFCLIFFFLLVWFMQWMVKIAGLGNISATVLQKVSSYLFNYPFIIFLKFL